ncbi:uncharacterized protein B0P05DRAFT_547517 [Gilbertella persicaria]|uniref:uncharacterized protein n=1 Tax=Gilbertella persicaria TaxID=101096 RepID=UPI002220E50B|nr:uncharacterized protein B0P05DRAFT_547517 [Gilbertella persicaria]KAI8075439.1 hypothetical protein B0P05DRAFT_547517 [Gilbertella persicaria]
MSELSTPNAHLQLSVNDLLHPTEKSESLLEALTSSQLEEIEKTLLKIKEKKQTLPQKLATPIPITQTASPSTLHHDWTLVAAQIAKALADSITGVNTSTANLKTNAKPPTHTGTVSDKTSSSTASSPHTKPSNDTKNVAISSSSGSVIPNHEPRTEVRDGVEWVSFVYSHHRVLRRYSIRTDVDKVDLCILGDQFKSDNCVYPRANLPREEYKGNRWAYETECNTLGWKLAYLNTEEIAGKRGLIQRAVDSYRNRYPSMRSRRVARQEKLLKGTLRKRKQQRDSEEPNDNTDRPVKSAKTDKTNSSSVAANTNNKHHDLPKTVSIDDGIGGTKYRIRINVDSVSLDSIDQEFRKANCVYPRAMEINTMSPFASQRQLEEAKCNELGWKLAWLNPKQLANRKSLLQRVLDVYRTKFLPELKIRKNSLRTPSVPTGLSIDTSVLGVKAPSTPLTVDALATPKRDSVEDNESFYSASANPIDFHDCFSPDSNDTNHDACISPSTSNSPTLSPNASKKDLMLPGSDDQLILSASKHPLSTDDDDAKPCRRSISSSSSSAGSDSASSPYFKTEQVDDAFFKDSSMFELYAEPIQLPSAGVDFEQSEYTKNEDEHSIDPLMSQLFHI